MGGALPLGYTVADKKLVPVPEEAETVRRIMRQYLDAANVPELRESLIRAGVTSKRVVSRKGNVRGGGPFSRGALHHLLSNRTYIGEVVHNGKVYPGEHEAIVDRNLFEAVQAKLADRTNVPLARSGRRNVSLLAGMIRDEHGRPMSPAHTRNHGRRYRLLPTVPMMTATLPRLPAGELDAAVKGALKPLLADPHQARALGAHLPPAQQQVLASASGSLAAELDASSVTEIQTIFHQFRLRVVISQHDVEATVSSEALLRHLSFDGGDDAALRLPIAAWPKSWGHEARLRLDAPSTKAKGDANLIQMIARGFAARDELLAMTEDDVRMTPRTRIRHLQRYARLAYLASDIIRTILDGSPASPSHRALSPARCALAAVLDRTGSGSRVPQPLAITSKRRSQNLQERISCKSAF